MKRSALFLVAAMMSGCGPSIVKDTILTDEDVAKVDGSLLEVVVPNGALQARINHSDEWAYKGSFAGPVGLAVGQIVDDSIDRSHMAQAQSEVDVMRRNLAGIDFAKLMADSLSKHLGEVPRLKMHDVMISDHLSRPATLEALQKSKNNAAVQVVVGQSMLPNLRGFRIDAEVHVFMNQKGAKDLYSTNVIYVSDLIPETNRESLLAAWNADGGKLLRQELSKAVQGASIRVAERLAQSKAQIHIVE